MELSDINKKLDSIESRIEKLEDKKKDFWDIFNSLATILIPAAIALAGYFISTGIKKAELDVAKTNAKVAQAELVNKFMSSLTSKSTLERSIAVDAIVIALPGFGADLVRSVAKNDTSSSVKKAAQKSLNNQMEKLIRDLFSDDAATRTVAAHELLKGWQSDSLVVNQLLAYAKENVSNGNGVYNVVVMLNAIDKSVLLQYKTVILEFLTLAEANGPSTAAVVKQVRARLR